MDWLKERRRMQILYGKNKIIVFLMFFMIMISGCGMSKEGEKAVVEEKKISIIISETEDTAESTFSSEDAKFLAETEEIKEQETIDEVYEGNWRDIVTSDMEKFDVTYKNINVEYPQFPTLKGYPVEINNILEEDVEYHCNDIYQISCPYDLKGKVTFIDKQYISVLYQGTGYPMTSAWDFAWGITIDIKTGETVSIEEVMDVSEVVKKLEQKEFEQVRGITFDFYKELRGKEINVKEKYEDLSMGSYDENHCYDFYLKKGKIGILIGVEETLGSYIIIELDR